MREQRPGFRGCSYFTLCCCLLAIAAYVGNSTTGQSTVPPPIRSKSAPITGVTLDIKPGIPPETVVSNITTGQAIMANKANAVTFSGLVAGSTNQFVAVNAGGGRSHVLTTLATNQVIASKIQIHSYKVTVPLKPGNATRVMVTTNLLTWYQIALVSSTNLTYQFIWTNEGAPMRAFRAVSP